MESDECGSKEYEPKEGVVIYKHYRYVDEFWRARKLEAVLERVAAHRKALGENEFELGALYLDELEAEIYGLTDLSVLLGTKVIDTINGDGEACQEIVRVGPFPYSRGTHKSGRDTENEGWPEEKNCPWIPDAVGGETVAAVYLNGEGYCVHEPCIEPDVFRYARGREIAEGRLRAGLAEMGIEFPAPIEYVDFGEYP